MLKVVAVLAAVGLAGCQGNKPLTELSYSELKKVADDTKQRCIAQGISETSPEWAACLKQEFNREGARRARVTRALNSDSGPVICNRFGNTTVCN